MKRKHLFTSLLLFAVAFSLMLTSCKKDPDPLELESLMAGTIDLNGATSPTNVPVNPTIVAKFTVDIDPATATASNITMVQDYDDAPITLTVSASGNTITITPQGALGTGALYQLSIGAGLKSVDAIAITPLQRTFTTAGTFAPAGAVAHFTFEDNANDIVGAWDPVAAEKGDFRHFMQKEIHEQVRSITDTISGRVDFKAGKILLPDLNLTKEFASQIERIIIIACGTALNHDIV